MLENNPENSSTQNQRSAIWLILWPLAILLRLSNIFGVFVDGQVFFYATDPYYHLRRIVLAFNNFPHVIDKDIYLNFSNGAPTHWPFGFDIIMAAIISVLTFGQADNWWIEAIGALLPVLIGGLLPPVIYLIALELSDQFTALLAGILSALLPMSIHYAQIGNLDHHFFAALCQALFLLTYLRASQKEKPNIWSILSGIVLLVAATATTEFPFIIAIHCIYLFVVWFRVDRKRQNELILINLKIFLTITLLLLPCIFTNYFEPNGVSPLLASSWFGCFAFSTFLAALATGKKLTPYSFSIIFITLAIIATLVFDFSLISKLLAEFQISQGNSVIAKLIRENDPIIFAGLKALLYWQSGFLLLTPITIFLLFRHRSESNLLILVALVIMQPLTLAHERFGVLLIVPFSLASAILAKEGMVIVKTYLPKQRLGELLGATIILLALLPCLVGINFASPTIVIKNRSFAPLYNAFTWLKNNSPKVNPEAPEYGVIANQWDLGHWIVHFAERPTVSSPLLHTSELAQAVFDSAKIFVQPPKTALKALENRKLQYLIITQDDFNNLLELAGNNIDLIKQNEGLSKELLYQSLYGQLLLSYGFALNDPTNYQLERFRLVYETKETSKVNNLAVPVCMIFEIVKGAHLIGQTKPGSLVTATTELKTPRERSISYSTTTKADENGKFDLILPYATGGNNNTNIFASSYVIKTEQSFSSLVVKESQVKNGETIEMK
ncbi:MAG: hypothetical protein HY819_23085 [Acidobacteria bacterium]|nr:hypothetical protein [Acidobacteriota bacterium]